MNEFTADQDPCLFSGDTFHATATAIAERVHELEDVLTGMAQLHDLEDGEIPLFVLGRMPQIRVLQLSWELLGLLADADERYILEIFDEIDEFEAAFLLMEALYGDPFGGDEDEDCDCDCGCCDEDEDDLVVVRPIR